ncbi:hypothetical protein CR513_27347, partial [Mucuna pruriens]
MILHKGKALKVQSNSKSLDKSFSGSLNDEVSFISKKSKKMLKPPVYNEEQYAYWKDHKEMYVKSIQYNLMCTTKEMWDALKVTHEGTKNVQLRNIVTLEIHYEMFRLENGKTVTIIFFFLFCD